MTRRKTHGNLDLVGDLPHPYRRERSSVAHRIGSIMTVEQIIGFAVLAQLSLGTILYSMGYRDGKSVGYMRGRAVQMASMKSKAVK